MADRQEPPEISNKIFHPIFFKERTEHHISNHQKDTGLEQQPSAITIKNSIRVTSTSNRIATSTTTTTTTATVTSLNPKSDSHDDVTRLTLENLLHHSDLSSASAKSTTYLPPFKRETSTVGNLINIRPTYIPRKKSKPSTEKASTNPLLDPNFQPISKSTDSKPKIQKASLFPLGKSSASKPHLFNFSPLFFVTRICCFEMFLCPLSFLSIFANMIFLFTGSYV